MSRVLEFFQDDNKQLSMTRLLCLLSFGPATAMMFMLKSENALLTYLGAYVFGYIGGKGADAWQQRGGKDGAGRDS